MHIALCDDNIDELSRICSIIENYRNDKNTSITYEAFHSATELLEAIKVRHFDLLFLDILMPGITGMEAAKEIRFSNYELPIIFLTSSREFAVESYRVNAEDYIMKPAKKDEIFPVIHKQFTKFLQENAYLTLKTDIGITKIPFSNIVYVEVANRRIKFYLTEGEIREGYGYLADYESILLTDSYFYKPHRSYLVNLRCVTELDKKGFITTLGKIVPIARTSFSNAKAAYMKYLLSQSNRRNIL